MNQRELFEAWYASQDQSEPEPEKTYELSEAGMEELTKDCLFQGWKAAQAQQPAQATTAQEPAGYMRSDGMKAIVADEKSAWIESGKGDVVGDYTVPLYTHPAPQRKSLTPMQLADIENRHNWQTTAGRFAIYREIEATKGQT